MNTPKKTYHHGDLRNALLDAAEQLLEEKGLQGFTLRGCARLANVSHAAPAHHFGDVKCLLTEVAQRGYERLVAELETQISQVKGNLEDEMYATSLGYLAFAKRYPEHFRIMFRADLINMDATPSVAARATFTELTNVILRQRGDREMTLAEGLDFESQALINDILMGWCHIHGFAHLYLEGQLMIVQEGTLESQMRECTRRLSQLIQSHITHQIAPK